MRKKTQAKQAPDKKQLLISRLRSGRYLLSIIGGFFLLTYGVLGAHSWWQRTHKVSSPAAVSSQLSSVVTNSTDTPDETKIDPNLKFNVPADTPRQIILPTIKASGFIQKVGIDQHDQMAVPSNVHFAGWYTNSAKPGDLGLGIIDGHVVGNYEAGIFFNLGKLKEKDTFQIEYGDLSRKKFQVTNVSYYSVADATKNLFAVAPGIDRQLKLITCGGKYDAAAHAYDQRIIVTAKLIN